MNNRLIKQFRDKINDESLIYHIYKNNGGKNQWSIICSAMDWIEVAIDGIDLSNLSRQNSNSASIKMITFVSCIDVMWEGIQQLHRVIYNTNEIPFMDDKSIFCQDDSDNIFFKRIRACFAAHPVNLNNGCINGDKSERWYASWSGGTFSKKDFAVILYSNNPEKDSQIFGISFIELYDFANKRYQYLLELINQIDKNIEEYKNKYRSELIETNPENVVETINILIKANKERLDYEYYDYELEKLKLVYEITCSNEKNRNALELYKLSLVPLLKAIKDGIQNMNEVSLESYKKGKIPRNIEYDFSRLSNVVFGEDMSFEFFFYDIKRFKSCFEGVVEIEDDMSLEEVYVLSCAGAYLLDNS